MNIEEKIKVMQHFAKGGEVEVLALYEKHQWQPVYDPSWNWTRYAYRIKDSPKYVAFEMEDYKQFYGFVIFRNETFYRIIAVAEKWVLLSDNNKVSYNDLLNYEFLDRNPCGKLVDNNT